METEHREDVHVPKSSLPTLLAKRREEDASTRRPRLLLPIPSKSRPAKTSLVRRGSEASLSLGAEETPSERIEKG